MSGVIMPWCYNGVSFVGTQEQRSKFTVEVIIMSHYRYRPVTVF